MTRQLKKEIWPYKHFIKDSDINYEVVSNNQGKVNDWLFSNFNENIKNRVYIMENTKGITYYFKDEKDYSWFVWRWG